MTIILASDLWCDELHLMLVKGASIVVAGHLDDGRAIVEVGGLFRTHIEVRYLKQAGIPQKGTV